MDTLLKETINETVNRRFPEMTIESRKLLASIVTRKDMEKGEILERGTHESLMNEDTRYKAMYELQSGYYQ